MDCALAVAAKGETVGHVATTILAKIKSMLALVGMLGVSVRDNHLGQRKTIENISDVALVIVGDIVEDDTLTVVKTDVDVPVLPFNRASLNFKGDALWLCDVDWLQVRSVASLLFHGLNVIVVGSSFAERTPHRRNVNVDNLLRLRIVDRAKVQGVGVLRIINVRAVVHQSLLQANIRAKTLIVSDRPG
jgi:hypothetical protein